MTRGATESATGARTITSLRRAYAEGTLHPRDVATEAMDRARTVEEAVWIHRLDEATVLAHVEALDARDFEAAPLWGVPFAIKDNIDLAGAPTTAACPDFAYTPERSATVVERLLAAGAIPIGKTNLDQFATGLVGTRSPHGAVANAIDPAYIAGGSSSGSAAAVRHGVVPFALGTDTAGSGRIPAAFNGLVGFKPTRGWWSTRGVVPACRTLDCVSVFAHAVADARIVADVAGGFDAQDPFSREVAFRGFSGDAPRLGYLSGERLPWFDDAEYPVLYERFIGGLSGRPRMVDQAPFLAAGRLLYGGPWLAERVAAVGDFLAAHPNAVHPVTRRVIEGGRAPSAVDCFRARYRLAELRREAAAAFDEVDVLVAPTAPTHYRLAEVDADPLETNARLGTFTNCVNLLDLCAVAIPAGTTTGGPPVRGHAACARRARSCSPAGGRRVAWGRDGGCGRTPAGRTPPRRLRRAHDRSATERRTHGTRSVSRGGDPHGLALSPIRAAGWQAPGVAAGGVRWCLHRTGGVVRAPRRGRRLPRHGRSTPGHWVRRA